MLIFAKTIVIAALFVTTHCMAASVQIISKWSFKIEDKSYYWDYDEFNAVIIDPETLLLSSANGIWANGDENGNWIKLMGRNPDEYFIEKDISTNRLLRFKYPPSDMVLANGEIIIVDELFLYSFKFTDAKDTCYVVEWNNGIRKFYEDKRDGENIANICLYNNLLLLGLYLPNDGDKFVVIQKTDRDPSEYFKRIFRCPDSLRQTLEHAGVKYPHSIPAYNPHVNNIWLSVWGYEYVYIIDTTGQLQDSLKIPDNSYIRPQMQLSKIHSQAVWRDWLLRWTPQRNFNYVSPGYFILQYRTGFELLSNDTIPLFSTIIWDYNTHQIDIDIDKHWQVAGVHPDGRIIFAHYIRENRLKAIEVLIARLLP